MTTTLTYILILGRQAQFNLNQASLEQNKENRPFPLQNKTSSYSILTPFPTFY